MDQYYCWRLIKIGGHLSIIVGGAFKLIGKIKLKELGPPGTKLLLGVI